MPGHGRYPGAVAVVLLWWVDKRRRKRKQKKLGRDCGKKCSGNEALDPLTNRLIYRRLTASTSCARLANATTITFNFVRP